MCYKSAVVHLSDMQFGPKNRAKQPGLDELVGEAYAESIKNLADDIEDQVITKHEVNRDKVGLIVSGDITEHGTDTQFKDAHNMMKLLLERLEIPPCQLAFVPGNHDVNWDDCKNAYQDTLKRGGKDRDIAKGKMRSSPEKLARYTNFVRDLCGTEFEIEKPTVFDGFVNLGIALVGLDSTYPCLWNVSNNYGVLRWEQIKAAGDELKLLLADDVLLIPIAVVHHSLLPERRGNRRDKSYLREAREVRRFLRGQGFGTVLCGHEHTPDRSSDLDGTFKILVTGSFGLSTEELMKGKDILQRAETNKYEIILVNPEGDSKILYRRLNTTDYDVPMGRWEQDLSGGTSSDKVVLWSPRISDAEIGNIGEQPEVELVVCEPEELPNKSKGENLLIGASIYPKQGSLKDIVSVLYKVEPGGDEVPGDPKCSFIRELCLEDLRGRSVVAIVKDRAGRVQKLVRNLPVL